jgi:hypothetical protein
MQRTAIFDYFSNLRIFNYIIVCQVHDVREKDNSKRNTVNDVDTEINLDVYTWFPYQSSDRCTEVNDITLLDSWVISAQGHFNKKTNFFLIKIRNSFKGCPMKAVVRDVYGFIETYYLNGNVSSENDIKTWRWIYQESF